MGKEKPRTRSKKTPKSPDCIPNKRQRKTLRDCNHSAKKSLTKNNHKLKMSAESNNSTEFNDIETKKTLKAVPLTDLNDFQVKAKNMSEKVKNSINMEEKEELNKDWKRQGELLEALCDALAEPPEKAPETGYTHDDLKQFLLNSTIREMFRFALETSSISEVSN